MPVPEKPEGVTEGQWTDCLPHLKQLGWEALWDNAMEHANDGESKLNTPPQSHAAAALRTSCSAASLLARPCTLARAGIQVLLGGEEAPVTVHITLGPFPHDLPAGRDITASVGHNAMGGKCTVKPDDLAARVTAGEIEVGWVLWIIRGVEIGNSIMSLPLLLAVPRLQGLGDAPRVA